MSWAPPQSPSVAEIDISAPRLPLLGKSSCNAEVRGFNKTSPVPHAPVHRPSPIPPWPGHLYRPPWSPSKKGSGEGVGCFGLRVCSIWRSNPSRGRRLSYGSRRIHLGPPSAKYPQQQQQTSHQGAIALVSGHETPKLSKKWKQHRCQQLARRHKALMASEGKRGNNKTTIGLDVGLGAGSLQQQIKACPSQVLMGVSTTRPGPATTAELQREAGRPGSEYGSDRVQ